MIVADYRVAGLDGSLTGFGIAVTCGPRMTPLLYRLAPRTRGHERLEFLLSEVRRLADGADLCVLEGLSFGARGSALLDLAGLHWMVRHLLWEMRIPYAVVAPAQVKQYMTGNGGADKIAVAMAVSRKLPQAEVTSSDTADALALAAMGAHWAGEPLFEPTKAQAEVLYAKWATKGKKGLPKIAWPDAGRAPEVPDPALV
jgi:Holliday junction resolvasome RuvABC endonuclease subunit